MGDKLVGYFFTGLVVVGILWILEEETLLRLMDFWSIMFFFRKNSISLLEFYVSWVSCRLVLLNCVLAPLKVLLFWITVSGSALEATPRFDVVALKVPFFR